MKFFNSKLNELGRKRKAMRDEINEQVEKNAFARTIETMSSDFEKKNKAFRRKNKVI